MNRTIHSTENNSTTQGRVNNNKLPNYAQAARSSSQPRISTQQPQQQVQQQESGHSVDGSVYDSSSQQHGRNSGPSTFHNSMGYSHHKNSYPFYVY